MRILITGGNGFIGAWIARRLAAEGHELRLFDIVERRDIVTAIAGAKIADAAEWVTGEIVDGLAVKAAAAGCDGIIHMAGILTPACAADPVRGAQVNVIGTLNMFEAARAHGIKHIVYTSSAGVFGPDQGTEPFPITHYGTFKLANEGAARAYFADHGVASVGFRPYVVFGPGRESGLTAGPQTLLGSALLAPPDNYGGPTPTMALLPGSPARNVANHAPNASFEANTFGGSFSYTNSLPGGAITGWTSSPSNRTGLCVNGSPFANGGLITEGTKAAFLQCFSDGVATTLSTTLTGLTVGTNYTVTFRTAGRQGPVPGSTWSINGGAPVAFNGSPVGAGQPFRTIIGTFTATASTAALAFTNQTAPGTDTTVLIDAVTVAPTTPTDQRGFPIVGVPDLGAYEAGTLNNFNAWIYETLPVTATAPQHAATFDFDGDGQSNEKEWTARTDPGSASSYFRVTQSALSGGQFQVTIPTVAGRRYTLESSPDLVNWTDGPGHLALGTSHTFNVFFFEMPAMRFFKVRVGDP